MDLVWRDQLSVGNDAIDSDHMHLIEIINMAEQSLKAKSPSELMFALDSLSSYSQEHFVREEKIASAVDYIHAQQLKLAHDALLSKLDLAKKGLNAEWTESAIEKFAVLLRDWLLNHVIKEDLLMKPALEKFPPQFEVKDENSAKSTPPKTRLEISSKNLGFAISNLYIIWRKEDELGIPIIDEQHRAIVGNINSLFFFIQMGSGLQALRPTLNTLDQYTNIHFQSEEGLLKHTGYSDFDAHALLHQELLKKMAYVVQESILQGDPAIVMTFLKEWWMSHINQKDREYAAYLGSKSRLSASR